MSCRQPGPLSNRPLCSFQLDPPHARPNLEEYLAPLAPMRIPARKVASGIFDVPLSGPDGSDVALDVNGGIDGKVIPQLLDGALDVGIDASAASVDTGIDTTPALDAGIDAEGVDGSTDVS